MVIPFDKVINFISPPLKRLPVYLTIAAFHIGQYECTEEFPIAESINFQQLKL